MTDIQKRLFALADPANAELQRRLTPGLQSGQYLGIRFPDLRRLAREIGGSDEANAFLRSLPHQYFDENNLHAVLISNIRDFNACVAALDAFLPFVDNWSACDTLGPVCFKKHADEALPHIRRWINSAHAYTCRFGIGALMKYYLDERFDPEYLSWAAAVRSEEYYVNMMVAWYFATALAKQYDAALPWIENKKLAPWTHNKAIQKAIESYRVSPEHKEALRKLKVQLAS